MPILAFTVAINLIYWYTIIEVRKGGARKMENVSQENKNVSQKSNKGLDKMEKSVIDFIVSNDFLTTFIKENVIVKIYEEKSYSDGMIEEVIENDLNNSYSNGYIVDSIIDEIDIYNLVDKIDEIYIAEFMEIAERLQERNY